MNFVCKCGAILFSLLALCACAVRYPNSSAGLNVESTTALPEALSETSGLFCEKETLLSLNDSGNDPVIFTLDYKGNIVNQSGLSVHNKDWEAITADETFYYIADVGNNKGRREQVEIYQVSKHSPEQHVTITLRYAGNDSSNNIPYAHDYDSEAMVKVSDDLLLFSKSWRTGITHVYHVNEAQPEQMLSPIGLIKGLPGVVTGVDFDKTRNLFVLVGYKSDPFGNFATFMAQVSLSYEVINVWPLENFKQVEGVCVDSIGDYWFSEEATEGRAASLSRAVITQ